MDNKQKGSKSASILKKNKLFAVLSSLQNACFTRVFEQKTQKRFKITPSILSSAKTVIYNYDDILKIETIAESIDENGSIIPSVQKSIWEVRIYYMALSQHIDRNKSCCP